MPSSEVVADVRLPHQVGGQRRLADAAHAVHRAHDQPRPGRRRQQCPAHAIEVVGPGHEPGRQRKRLIRNAEPPHVPLMRVILECVGDGPFQPLEGLANVCLIARPGPESRNSTDCGPPDPCAVVMAGGLFERGFGGQVDREDALEVRRLLLLFAEGFHSQRHHCGSRLWK